MHLITLDFETYFSKDFSLKKIPTVLYVRDPRFYVQGVGIKFDDDPTQWVSDDLYDIEVFLNELPWANSALIGHNLLFDGMVLADHYGIIPREYRDTRSMANLLLPTGIKRNLDTVAKLLGHPGKIQGTLDKVKGVRYPSAELLAELGDYCIQDVEATRFIHDAMWSAVPEEEKQLASLTTRLGVASRVELDAELLRLEIKEQTEKRDSVVLSGNTPASVLRSNDQFLALLKTLVDPDDIPMKEGKRGLIPAFGKADAGWVQFKAKYDELSDLLDAREAAKSNILTKRAERFLEVAETPQGTLPMPYLFWGAHTGRWSGTGGLNVMNLPATRISRIRHCLKAPRGHVIHVVDSSQIELRVQLWLSGQMDKHNKLANGEDLYKSVASEIFGKPVAEINKQERAIAKAASLGCQYGMGHKRYRAYMAGGPLGMPPLNLTEAEAQAHVNGYRATHPYTVAMWRKLDAHIPYMATPHEPVQIGPLTIEHERLGLPNGTWIDYTGLHCDEEGNWRFGVGQHWAFIHGARALENAVQSLSRIPIGTAALAAEEELEGIELAGFTHDELILIGEEHRAEENQAKLLEIMRRVPDWANGLVLDADGSFGPVYDK